MDNLSFLPLGGIGDVTKNMYLYQYKDQILIVDCGLGFADETMLGVDLLLPDISYLLKVKKKIVGLVLTHGHEDHIGAVPFILPQLTALGQSFPVYGSPLTAAFTNEKLKEFGVPTRVQTVPFEQNERVMGDFKVSFIRVTHSVPDTSHLFIETPVGNIYHGSDFKFDLTPADGKKTDFARIAKAADKGILCLMSDCLGSERTAYTRSEESMTDSFEREMKNCKGKFIVTTYSSNIARLNQIIEAAERLNRKICFVGRSLIKAKEVAIRLGYMKLRKGLEIEIHEVRKYPDNQVLLMVAGSQGQENSGMSRIANGEHKEIFLKPDDMVVFSSDPIPGNEVMVNSLVDSIAKTDASVIYSGISSEFHVSGHGAAPELMLLISLTKPRYLVPIGGTFKHMVAYQKLGKKLGYHEQNIILLDDGQEVVYTKQGPKPGQKINTKNVYVDDVSGEELENFVLRDRQRLSEGGIVIVMVEVESATGSIVTKPDIIIRGFIIEDTTKLNQKIMDEYTKSSVNRKGRVTNWVHVRNLIGEIAERQIFRELRRRPLVLPIVIEV